MTTLQPRLIRADTLDLQSQNAPSAKDHTRSPTFTPYAHGAAGSHHREALRHAEESAYHDNKTNPRLSNEDPNSSLVNHSNQYDSTDDDGDDEQHDDKNSPDLNDGEYEDGPDENDDDLEDDLLDKISSSPSIEDGKYPHFFWPQRVDSIRPGDSPAPVSTPIRGTSLSSIFTSPSAPKSKRGSEIHRVGHHLRDSKIGMCEDETYGNDENAGYKNNETHLSSTASPHSMVNSTNTDTNTIFSDDISHLLLPLNDPIFDENDPVNEFGEDDEQDWVDEGAPWYEDGYSSDDDPDDFQFSDDPRFIDSGWGGECLRDIEDIDFEFVYALHTFVATVEGQANATKGDTMVLLDDSNSYWWLVRVVKDGSIGYLPAEHIETPTERLARLNKHRNIDLSASMLGDNPEKSKNPLKKAMRRRNAKTVAFTAPTYYEPSEYEYDTEDEEDDEGVDGIVNTQQQDLQQTDANNAQENIELTESQDSVVIVNGVKKVVSDNQLVVDSPTSPVKTDTVEPVSHQIQTDENIQRSRNGVVRNTDSFFKDDTVETKKISLTPRLLWNDAESTTSTEPDLRSKASSDTFDKLLGPDDRPKEKEKEKKKEKKGMLSGLFKRKDKSAKNAKAEVEDEKIDDTSRSPQTKEPLEPTTSSQSPDKKSSKLQKAQQSTVVPLKNPPPDVKQPPSQIAVTKSPTHSPKTSESGFQTATPAAAQQDSSVAVNNVSQPEQGSAPAPVHSEKRSIFAPITTALKSTPSNSHHHHEHHIMPVYSKRAKERFAIDDSDSEDDHTPTMSQVSQDVRAVSPMRDSQLHDSRPDSAVEISPVDVSDSDNDDRGLQPAGLMSRNVAGAQHTSAQHVHDTPQSDTASTSKPSPSLATHTPSTSRSTPTWSDASLRSYMENDQDIRDLLIIVHDKSNITPVGPDHPLMGGMFMTERTRLAEMQTQLDSMLTSWISKKNPGLLAR